MANWEELPHEILQLIARRLAIDDFMALRGVCTSWRSAAVIEMYSVKTKAPWCMKCTRHQVEFLSPSGVKSFRVQLSVLRCPILFLLGWMLMSTSVSDYRILNPISRLGIKLPTLEKMRCRPSEIDRIALSSSPSLSRNYTVMVSIRRHLEPLGLALHRSGEDSWTVLSLSTHQPQSNVRGLVRYDGLFVALDEHYQITTFDERERCMRLRLVLGQNLKGRPYLVECSGSLLVAWKIRGEGDGTECSFRVFKIDLQKGTEEEVKSLGNASLFLNVNSLFSVEFKAETCLPEIKPNRIYFPTCVTEIKPNCIYFPGYRSKEMYVYSMEDGKFERYRSALGMYYFSLQWFQPGY